MLFLITGPDTYRAKQKIKELKAKFVNEVDATGLNIERVDGTTVGKAELGHYFATVPLLARRRFILIEGLLIVKNKEVQTAAQKILSSQKDDNNIIVLYEEKPVPKSSGLGKWLHEHAYVQQYDVLSDAERFKWLQEACRKRNIHIDNAALRLLLARTADDLWSLSNALAKVIGASADGKEIDEKLVETMVKAPNEDKIFPLVDAIIRRDIRTAVPLLEEQIAQGLSPQQLIALLETQFRVLVILTDSVSVPTVSGVHPYVVKKLTSIARRSNTQQIRLLYSQLAEVDLALKQTKQDPVATFIAFLSAPVQTPPQ